jgi:hypothetical protein
MKMGKLACNIVSYRPDPDMLAANFRYWHVEELLNQAAVLIERCVEDFREYTALDFAWNQFQTELEAQEKQLDLEQKVEAKVETEGIPESEVAAPQEGEASPAEQIQEGGEEHLAETAEAEPAWAGAEVSAAPETQLLQIRAEAVQRKKELAGPGRPFALDEQRDLILKRVCRDYEEAVNRACVAHEGLSRIFGLDEMAAPIRTEAETLAASITTLSIWIQNAIEWLVEYQHLEQSFTRVVSLRSLLNRSAWVQLKQARDSYSMKVQIPADLFKGYDNCRLKGVGAALIGEAGKVPWSVTLKLPEEAIYERSGRSVTVDQSNRATCLLGRVENRRSYHPVEVCGETTLINASPIGKSYQTGNWSIDLYKPAGSASESFAHVEDLVLELQLSGYPKKA